LLVQPVLSRLTQEADAWIAAVTPRLAKKIGPNLFLSHVFSSTSSDTLSSFGPADFAAVLFFFFVCPAFGFR